MDDDREDITIRAVPPTDLPAHQRLRLARVITDMLRGRDFICDLAVPSDPTSPNSAGADAKSPTKRNHVKYCRDRAEECRQLAEMATSASVQQSYLRLAQSYDALAIEESTLNPIRRDSA
jgi:hypothetical protein